MKKWILRTIGERWRQHKSNLKSRYFDEHKSTKANHSNVPNDIIADQWIALVDNWTTKKAQVHGYFWIYIYVFSMPSRFYKHLRNLNDFSLFHHDMIGYK
jgi:hypothetical protein